MSFELAVFDLSQSEHFVCFAALRIDVDSESRQYDQLLRNDERAVRKSAILL